MTYPTVISFYTKTWEYVKHANRLKQECESLKLDYHIVEKEDTGSWLGNTRLKPKFILDSITTLKRPVLWIDVDGSILRTPIELQLPFNYDFLGIHQRIGPKRTWHVGTMVFNYTPKMLKLLQAWVDVANDTTSGTDEASFESVWQSNLNSMNLFGKELPLSYFTIENLSYNDCTNPVIRHRLSKCESKMKMKNSK